VDHLWRGRVSRRKKKTIHTGRSVMRGSRRFNSCPANLGFLRRMGIASDRLSPSTPARGTMRSWTPPTTVSRRFTDSSRDWD
jgi:hypothetical protein